MAFSVNFDEIGYSPRVDGAPREEGDILSRAATRVLRCNWSDRETLIDELLSPADGNNVYPYNDWGITAYRFGVRPAGALGTSGSLLAPAKADITVHYSTAGPLTANLLTEEYLISANYQRADHRNYYYDEGGTKVPMKPCEAPVRVEPVGHYKLTFHRLAAVPNGSRTLVGYVNSNTVSSYVLGIAFPAGTLRYDGMYLQNSLIAVAASYLKCTLTFTEFIQGWNKIWNPRNNQYELVKIAEGANADNNASFYPTAAFTF